MNNVAVGGRSLPCALWKLWFDVLDFFRAVMAFMLGGEKCIRCGREKNAMPLCPSCATQILSAPVLEQSRRCRICGKVLISQIDLCSYCRESPTLKSVDMAYPIETYQLWKKEILFTWKTDGKRALSRFFASWFVVVVNSLLIKNLCDASSNAPLFIVPVPPRPGKIRKTGWDQIAEVCFYLEKEYGLKILPLLKRRSKTQQKKLDMEQRLETIGKNYCAKEPREIEKIVRKIGGIPERVLVVDDVMTTGSTLENCAAVLKEKGVKKVYAITLFGV